MSIEAMKLALEYLKQRELAWNVQIALRQAIADAEQAQPVITKNEKGLTLHVGWDDLPAGTKLYTAPPPRQPLTDEQAEVWVTPKLRPLAKLAYERKPLSDEEIKRMAAKWFLSMYWPICNTFAREIEAAHGIKGEA